MKKIICLFTLVITITSCKFIDQAIQDTNHQYKFNEIVANADKIVIMQKKENQIEGSQNDTVFDQKTTLQTHQISEVNFFRNLLNDTPKTDYCCCPETNYSISFYHNDKINGTYFVDEVQFENKVQIFEPGYQFSFIIDKSIWKNYLKRLRR